MSIAPAEVVRHFLRLEAKRPKYSDKEEEILAWCKLSDSEVMERARHWGEQRDDVNPALVYTVGIGNDARNSRVASWTRERIQCGDIFTCGMSSCMRPDIDAVRGNLSAFALSSAKKYPEFRPLSELCDMQRIVILVAHRQDGRDGNYEAIDGVHRLVAFCCSGIQEVEAYVAHIQEAESA